MTPVHRARRLLRKYPGVAQSVGKDVVLDRSECFFLRRWRDARGPAHPCEFASLRCWARRFGLTSNPTRRRSRRSPSPNPGQRTRRSGPSTGGRPPPWPGSPYAARRGPERSWSCAYENGLPCISRPTRPANAPAARRATEGPARAPSPDHGRPRTGTAATQEGGPDHVQTRRSTRHGRPCAQTALMRPGQGGRSGRPPSDEALMIGDELVGQGRRRPGAAGGTPPRARDGGTMGIHALSALLNGPARECGRGARREHGRGAGHRRAGGCRTWARMPTTTPARSSRRGGACADRPVNARPQMFFGGAERPLRERRAGTSREDRRRPGLNRDAAPARFSGRGEGQGPSEGATGR